MSVFKLKRPVLAHGATLSELEFKAPIAADLLDIGGMPLTIDSGSGGGRFGAVPGPMMALLAHLAGVPPSSIGQMGYSDVVDASRIVLQQFIPPEGTPSKLIREPCGRDLTALTSLPYELVNEDGVIRVVINPRAMHLLLGVLTDQKASDLGQRPAYEWLDAALQVVGFLAV